MFVYTHYTVPLIRLTVHSTRALSDICGTDGRGSTGQFSQINNHNLISNHRSGDIIFSQFWRGINSRASQSLRIIGRHVARGVGGSCRAHPLYVHSPHASPIHPGAKCRGCLPSRASAYWRIDVSLQPNEATPTTGRARPILIRRIDEVRFGPVACHLARNRSQHFSCSLLTARVVITLLQENHAIVVLQLCRHLVIRAHRRLIEAWTNCVDAIDHDHHSPVSVSNARAHE